MTIKGISKTGLQKDLTDIREHLENVTRRPAELDETYGQLSESYLDDEHNIEDDNVDAKIIE